MPEGAGFSMHFSPHRNDIRNVIEIGMFCLIWATNGRTGSRTEKG